MAEAAGLAAGILSLSLQLYAGIAGYIDSFKDRKNQLATISAQAQNFHASITALQKILPSVTARQTDGGAAVSSALRTVEGELRASKLFFDKLTDSAGSAASISTTIQEHKKRLTFPFHRPTLEKLQKKLESANSALQTSIQVLGLATTDSVGVKISEVDQKLDESRLLIADVESHTKDMKTLLSSVVTTLAPTGTTVSSIKDGFDTSILQVNTSLVDIHESLAMKILDVKKDVADVSREIQLVKDDTQGTMTTVCQGFQTSHESSGMSLIRKDVVELNDRLRQLLRLVDDNEVLIGPARYQVVLDRLLSKPSDLKDAYEKFQQVTATGISPSTPRIGPGRGCYEEILFDDRIICHCRKSTKMKQQGTRLGAFCLIKSTITDQTHLPGYRYANLDTTSKSQVMLVSYTGFRRVLSTALELSIAWRSGAGGLSISPNITFRPMVDENTSPVFRLLHLFSSRIDNIFSSSYELTWDNDHRIMKQLIYSTTNNILKLYRERKCLPYEVGEYGESALHLWVRCLTVWFNRLGGSARFDYCATSSVMELAKAGTTIALFDYTGKSPLDILVKHINNNPTNRIIDHPRLTEALYTIDPDFASRRDPYVDKYKDIRGLWKSCNLLNKHPSLAGMLGLGPLSKAVVTGDVNRARYLLDRHPEALKEMNLAKQTVFHLAVDSSTTEILKILLEAAKNVSYNFNTPDWDGFHALERAAQRSRVMCRNESHTSQWKPCVDCLCVSSFMALQSYGWQLSSYRLYHPEYLLEYLLISSSYPCKLKIINTITSWRESFADMGRRFLTTIESHQFHLDRGCVLDGHLYMVVQRLTRRGMISPSRVEWIQTNRRLMEGTSVYHYLFQGLKFGNEVAVSFLEFLFKSGFREVDHKDIYGMTPLMSTTRFPNPPPGSILWFLNHGADPLAFWPAKDAWTSYNASLRAAHTVLNRFTGFVHRSELLAFRELIFKVAPLDLGDGCCCGCVDTGGCGTTKVLFKNLWNVSPSLYSRYTFLTKDMEGIATAEWDGRSKMENENEYQREEGTPLHDWILETSSKERQALRRRIYNLSGYLQQLAVDFSQWPHVTTAALRLLTFNALEMRHTCCRMPYPPEHSLEEIQEIQEEDHDRLSLLDDLVEEFTIELRDSQDVFEQFLVRYWVPRIEEVQIELDAMRMTADERLAAELVGIKWETPDADSTPDAESQPGSRILSPAKKLERLMIDIDEIMAEYR